MTFTKMTTTTAIALALATPVLAQEVPQTNEQTEAPIGMEAELGLEAYGTETPGDETAQSDPAITAAPPADTRLSEADAMNDQPPGEDIALNERESDALSADAGGDFMLAGHTVAQVVGMDVIAESGEPIGEIDTIYMANDTYMAIVGIGGFWGIGETDVAVPLENTVLYGNSGLSLPGYSEEDIRALPQVSSTDVVDLAGEHVIG